MKILVVVLARRVESKGRLAGSVRLDRFAFDGLPLTAIVITPLLLDIVVVPGIIMVWVLVVIERILIDDDFD